MTIIVQEVNGQTVVTNDVAVAIADALLPQVALAQTAQELAEDARDAALQHANDAAVVSGVDTARRASVATAYTQAVAASVQTLITDHYAPTYDDPATLVGGAVYVRVSKAEIDAAGYPAESYFRHTTDRGMPDGTTDATNGGYWLLNEKVVDPRVMGAAADAAADSQAAWQAAVTFASKFNPPLPVRSRGGGRYTINSTVTIPVDGQIIDLDGATIETSISDGSPVFDAAAGVDRIVVKNGVITPPNFNVANYVAGLITGQNCIGIQSWRTSAPFNTKPVLENMRLRGLAKGLRIGGFSGDMNGVRADFCDLGLEGTLLNDTTLGMRFEGCRQSYVITDGDGLVMRGSDQGSVANPLSSTIDDCRGLNMDGFYFEEAAGSARPNPMLIIGGTTEVTNLSATGVRISGSSGPRR